MAFPVLNYKCGVAPNRFLQACIPYDNTPADDLKLLKPLAHIVTAQTPPAHSDFVVTPCHRWPLSKRHNWRLF